MMLGVSGQWNMELIIGGKPFPANPTTVKEFFWFENIHQNLPSLNMTIADVDGTFTTIAAAGDGVPIEVVLGDGDKSGQTAARFNIQGQPQIKHGAGYNEIKMNAVLDAVPFMRSIASGLMEGTSSTVIAQLASQVGLTFLGDSTSDAMVWLPSNKTIASYVRDVASRGWVGPGSCMVTAVTDQRELIYRNIMQPNGGQESFGIGAAIPILSWEATSNAMLTNNNRGYGVTAIGFDEQGVVKELNKITFNMFSGFLPISQTNLGAIGQLGGRIDSIIRSAGNTHEKYEEAKHQNARLRDTFSTDLHIMTDMVSRSKLLDMVVAMPQDFTKKEINRVVAGPYLITARTRCLTRSKYTERLTLTSQGLS